MSFSTPPVVDRQTFYASQSAVAVALNKSMLSINNGASGKVLKIQNVFIVNSQITAVVGNVVQFDLLRTLHHWARDVKHISQGASSTARSPAAEIHLSVVSGMTSRSIMSWSSVERQFSYCCRWCAHREKCIFMRSKVPSMYDLINADGRRSLG